MSSSYDVVVIGAGSGGMSAAKKATATGASVAVVESRTAGGTCVARGCMPKKFLVIASEKMMDVQSEGPRGIDTRVENTDWSALIDHEQAVVDDLVDINRDGLVDYDQIDLIEGQAKLTETQSVVVGSKELEFDTLFIATGLRPARPPIKGRELGQTSDEFLRDRQLPDSMVIVGGGYIGVEFASVLDAFGVDVTILHRPPQLVKDHDDDVASVLEDQFTARGIEVFTGTEAREISETSDGYDVRFAHRGNEDTRRADRVLLATGRRPNTDDLGLDHAGVELTDNGFVNVDDQFQTTNDDVYAVGDVIGDYQYTPAAILEGKTAAENALEDAAGTVDYHTIPSAVFTHPEIGSVGYTESEARDRIDDPLEIATKQFTPYSATVKNTNGTTYVKLIYAGEEKELVGLHVCGPSGSEIVQGFALAMKKGVRQDDLKDFPGVHPTVAEEIFSTKPD